MWLDTADPPPITQYLADLILLWVIPRPWCLSNWWWWQMISSMMCPFLGRMMGCFAPYDRLERLILLPTLRTPLASRNGSSWWRELAFFIALFSCVTVLSPLVCPRTFNSFRWRISSGKAALWTILMILFSAFCNSSTLAGIYLLDVESFGSRLTFSSLEFGLQNFSWRRRQTATALLTRC